MNKELLVSFLSNPFVCGIVMTLFSWLYLDFWYNIINYHRKVNHIFITVVALLNGFMSILAELYTNNNASPRTMALYVPALFLIELLIFGHNQLWGTLMVFVISSFQFSTLFSVSIGSFSFYAPIEIINSRTGLVIPVTTTNLLLAFFLFSMKIYQYKWRDDRSAELSFILRSVTHTYSLFIYVAINSFAVTKLTYNAIDLVYTLNRDIHVHWIAMNMIVKDIILFFSTIMFFDLMTRNMRNEQIIDYEKKLRGNFHRNTIFKLEVDVTNNKIIELDDNIFIEGSADMMSATYEERIANIVNIVVHPNDCEKLKETLSVDNLRSVYKEDKNIDYSFRLSPAKFISLLSPDSKNILLSLYLNKDYIWTSLSCTTALDRHGIIHAYLYMLDIDKRKQEEYAIKRAATTDPLTGLLNRSSFTVELSKYIEKNNAIGSMFIVDLDYFKSVNDTLGHPAGDQLLIDVAKLFEKVFRSNDIICRMGGDEFCIFAKGLTDIDKINERARELNELGKRTIIGDNGKIARVSFSIGISTMLPDDFDIESLYSNADKALYQAKESGRGCYKIYEGK